MLKTGQLTLTHRESVAFRIGTETDIKLGKVSQVILSSDSQIEQVKARCVFPQYQLNQSVQMQLKTQPTYQDS